MSVITTNGQIEIEVYGVGNVSEPDADTIILQIKNTENDYLYLRLEISQEASRQLSGSLLEVIAAQGSEKHRRKTLEADAN